MAKSLKRIFLSAALAACCFHGCANSRPADTLFLDAEMLKTVKFQPPPAPGTPLYRADYAELRRWQAKRTPAQCGGAKAEANATLEQFFGRLEPFDPRLPAESLAFLKRAGREASIAAETVKGRYRRPRPFLVDKALSPCLRGVSGFAYPSGHATVARLYARMLSELAPGRRGEFMRRGDEGALNRVIGGVHHPSDVEAGKKLGDLLFAQFMRNPAFRAGMDKVRPFMAEKKP